MHAHSARSAFGCAERKHVFGSDKRDMLTPSCCAQDTAALCAHANLTYRVKGDTRCFYVLQIEVDLLTSEVAPDELDEDSDAPPPEDWPLHARRVRIMGPGVNEEAITRIWLARRDAVGTFLCCDAPTGRKGE